MIIFQNQWIETLINGIVSRRKCTSRYWVFKCYIRLNLYLRTTWTLKKMIYPKILLKNTILSNSSLSLNRVLWEMPLPSKSPLTLMKFTLVIYLMSQKYLLSLFVYLSNSAETPKKTHTVFFKLCRLNNIKDDFSKNDCEMKYIYMYMYTSRYSFDITEKLLKTS